MSAFTPNFQLEFIAPGEPIRNTRAVLERMTKSIDAALTRGGVAPPDAQDLVAVTGRVTSLEQRISPTDITSSTRPTTGIVVGRRYRETDTGDVIAHDGTRWVKVGGKPRLIANSSNSGGTGNLNSAAYVNARSLTVPAHTSGLLRLQAWAMWWSSGGQALLSQLVYGATMLAGSRVRGHNNGVANAPVTNLMEEYFVSDGSGQTCNMQAAVEATGGTTAFVESGFRVWLLPLV